MKSFSEILAFSVNKPHLMCAASNSRELFIFFTGLCEGFQISSGIDHYSEFKIFAQGKFKNYERNTLGFSDWLLQWKQDEELAMNLLKESLLEYAQSIS
jgi:hypothetical protein